MSKSKNNKLTKQAIKHLNDAFDILEGQFSNIPECCIEGFLSGRTYANVRNCLSEKDQKKLAKWNYVPCEKCFKNNNVKKLKLGTSVRGHMIFALIDSLIQEQ